MRSSSQSAPSQHLEYWIYAFIFIHVLVWTLVPAIVRHTLPMDSIEGAIWGHQLEWGYDKNPFVNGWLTALAGKISDSGWGIYLFSQFSVALCFWAVWKLGKKILSPIYACLAVLLLETMQYYNLHAIDLNDNTLEIGFWAITTLLFYQSLQTKKLFYWVLTGTFAGLCMMTKYYAAMLLLPMLLFMLLYPETRVEFKRPHFYIAFFIFILIIAPHIVWLFSHDFSTINYALNRVSSAPSLSNHFYFPFQFAWQQLEVFIPAGILSLFLLTKKNNQHKLPLSNFNKTFLIIVGLGPFLLTLLLSALTGIKLRAGWGQPLLTFWGLTLLAFWAPAITKNNLKRFLIMFILLFTSTVVAYCISLVRAPEPSSANFPGKIIATTLTKTWHDNYHSPLYYVVGPRWLAGNIAFYSADRPSVYIDAEKKYSPWIKESDLRKKGAIIVWDPTEEHQMPDLKQRFSTLSSLQVLHFTWLRNKKMAPVEFSVAFLPPE